MPTLTPEQLALFPLWYIAFLLSLTCHEAAHALAAQVGGDSTAADGGQVSLNPVPHMRRELFGTILMPMLSFLSSGWMMGWASAPYDPYWRMRHPHRAAWMALAGPAANFTLVLLAGLLIRLGMLAGLFAIPEAASFTEVAMGRSHTGDGVALFLSVLFSLNLVLGLFNLIPVPPLDGSSAVGLLLPEDKAARLYEALNSSPFLRFGGILIAWRLFEPVFGPAFGLALRALYPEAHFS